MRIVHLLILLIFFPLCIFSQAALNIGQPALHYQIEKSFTTVSLPNLKWVIEEQNEALSIDDIQQGDFKDANVISLKKNPFFKIKAHKPYWLKLQLSSKVELDSVGLILGLNGNGWPWEFTFKNVEAHIYKNGKKIRTGLSGTAAPYSKRDYPEKLDPSLIWIDINKGDTLDIWLNLEMAESMESEIEFDLYHHYLIKEGHIDYIYINEHILLNGAGIVLLLIALGLFFWFREPIYLWFMILQFLILLHHVGLRFHNETYLFMFRENPRVLVILSTFFSVFMFISLFLFGRVYINTKVKFPKLDFALLLTLGALFTISTIGIVLRAIPFYFADYWFSIRHIPMGIVFSGILVIIILLIFAKDKFARVFGFGGLTYIGFSLGRLVLINISKNPEVAGESMVILSNHFFLILTTTVILAYRFVLITQEKQLADKEKLNAELEQLKQQQLAEQKTKEAKRLEELDEIKSNFFSNITHEFRTPLTLIIEPLRQVLNQPEKPWLSNVQLAKNNSQKLLQLVNQLLDLSKLESEKMQLEYKRGNITELINPMMDSFALLAKEKGIQFEYIQKEQILPFDFDADKMEKIISNLISNAIKFTQEKGKVSIEVTTEELGDQAHFIFSIQDSGIGISEKEQEPIFDRFYQVDGSNTRKQQGTGIGLSLCKELVELMEGKLILESELGQGSTFTFRMPIRMNEEEVLTPSAINTYQPVLSNSSIGMLEKKDESIDIEADNFALIIEDNAELRQFIRSSIEDKYQVIEAENGKIGLGMALEYIPNIIISDLMMPEMDGFEVCQNIKTNEKTAHIPLILLTAKTAMDSRIQGLEYGADVYMNKPFSTKELLLQMKNLIEVRRMLQQKFSQELDEKSLLGPNAVQDKELANTESASTIISEFDKEFLLRFNAFIEENIEEELTIEQLAEEMAMSRTQLFRKLKGLLNQSPSEFLRNFRLAKAKQFLEEKKGNVSEIAYMVGFANQKYFSTKFKEKYGLSPNQI